MKNSLLFRKFLFPERFIRIAGAYFIMLVMVAFVSAENNPTEMKGGPMHLPPIGLINAFQFSPVVTGPLEIKNGSWNVSVGLRWMNIWNLHIESEIPLEKDDDIETFPFEYGTFLADYEVLCLTTCMSRGITDDFDFTLSVPVYYLGGGIMDGFIQNFHDWIHVNQHYRDYSEKNQIRIFYVDEQNRRHILRGSDIGGTHLGDIVVYAGYRLRNRHPAAALRLGIKLPTNTGMIPTEQEGVDIALSYSLGWYPGVIYLSHWGGVIYYSDTGLEMVHFKRWRLVSATTLEWPFTAKISALAHFAFESPSADFPELKENVSELTLGVRIYQKHERIDIGLTENLFWYDNSPDFGIHIEYSRRF